MEAENRNEERIGSQAGSNWEAGVSLSLVGGGWWHDSWGFFSGLQSWKTKKSEWGRKEQEQASQD